MYVYFFSQHTFIPVLPNSLIDFCGSPLPFIIGINPSMAKKLDKLDIEMEEVCSMYSTQYM